MTYLQLINSVLVRLRETSVADLTATYTLQVGAYVNEAKTIVENAWNWSALRDENQVTTADGTAQYTLTGSANRIGVDIVTDATNKNVLRQRSVGWLKSKTLQSGVSTGAPVYYVLDGVDASGDTTVTLYPTPDGVYTINFEVFQRSADFTTASQATFIPSQPIIDYAYALAAEERGDAGGPESLTLYARAQRSLGDAVAHDAGLDSASTDWAAV
jgi:hypothetical protein